MSLDIKITPIIKEMANEIGMKEEKLKEIANNYEKKGRSQELFESYFKKRVLKKRKDSAELFPKLQFGKLNFTFNPSTKEVCVLFPIAGGDAKMYSKKSSGITYQLRVVVNDKEKFSFKTSKIITDIGDTKRCSYHKLLFKNLESKGITPHYDGNNFTEKFNNFILDLQTANGDISEILSSGKWLSNSDNRQENKTKESYFDAIESKEEFDSVTITKAKKLLKDGSFLNYAVETISEVVKAQEDKITLVFLIAMSSVLKDSLGGVALASPGKGKSRITETVFKTFPSQRKLKFNRKSTVSGIVNMTKFLEGSEIMKGKLIYLCDMGNTKEQDDPEVREIFSLFKELLTADEHSKILSDMTDDERKPIKLVLKGCGAILLEATSESVQEQFQDRSVHWSPNDTPETRRVIKGYLQDDIGRLRSKTKFEEKRRVVACGVDIIFNMIEEHLGSDIEILNPYTAYMEEIFLKGRDTGFRNHEHLYAFPRLVTLANLLQRKKYVDIESQKPVFVVTPEDFLYTLKVVGGSLAYMLSNTPENVLSYIEFIDDKYVDENEWKYTKVEYKEGFDKVLGKTEQNEFDEYIRNSNPVFASDVAKEMSVDRVTALKYLYILVENDLLYLKPGGGSVPHTYYPVSSFKELKKDAGVSFLSDNEINNLMPEIEIIYEEYIEKMKGDGFKI